MLPFHSSNPEEPQADGTNSGGASLHPETQKRTLRSVLACALCFEIGIELLTPEKAEAIAPETKNSPLLLKAQLTFPSIRELLSAKSKLTFEVLNLIDSKLTAFSEQEVAAVPQIAKVSKTLDAFFSAAIKERCLTKAFVTSNLELLDLPPWARKALERVSLDAFGKNSGSNNSKLEIVPKALLRFKNSEGASDEDSLDPVQQNIHRFFEVCRHRLLDNSLKNPLVNFERDLRESNVPLKLGSLKQSLAAMAEGRPLCFSNFRMPEPQVDAVQVESKLDSKVICERLAKLAARALENSRTVGNPSLCLSLGLISYPDQNADSGIRMGPLFLLPVTVKRDGAAGAFSIFQRPLEIEPNVALFARLEKIFNVQIPNFKTGSLEEISESVARFEEAIAGSPIKLENEECSVCLHAAARYLMSKDLDFKNAPKGYRPWDHKQTIISSLFKTTPELSDTEKHLLSKRYQLESNSPAVMDMDSSQHCSIVQALHSPVHLVQGPPGTGKSTTIVNLIARAVAEGKTILFLAKKTSAHEVVAKRLEEIGLGSLFLRLDDPDITKAAVRSRLREVIALGRPIIAEPQALKEANKSFQALREREHAFTATFRTTGRSPIEVINSLAALGSTVIDERLQGISLGSSNWSKAQRVEIISWCSKVGALAKDHHLPEGNAKLLALFAGNPLSSKQFDEIQIYAKRLQACNHEISLIEEQLKEIIPSFKSKFNSTLVELLTLLPDNFCLDFVNSFETLSIDEEKKRRLFTSITNYQKRANRIEEQLLPHALKAPAREYQDQLIRYQDSWSYLLRPGYYSLKRTIDGLFKEEFRPKNNEERISKLSSLRILKFYHVRLREVIPLAEIPAQDDENNKKATSLPSPDAVIDTLAWLSVCKKRFPDLSWEKDLGSQFVELLNTKAEWRNNLKSIWPRYTELEERREQLRVELGDLISQQSNSTSFNELAVTEQQRLISLLADSEASEELLLAWQKLLNLAPPGAENLRDLILANLETEITKGIGDQVSYLADKELLENCIAERPELLISGPQYQKLQTEYQHADQVLKDYWRSQIAHNVWYKIPREEAGGQSEAFNDYLTRIRSAPEIRSVFEHAPNAVLRTTPVIFASPEAVVRYLPKQPLRFDMLIVDEASQLFTEELLPSLLRANQLCIIGDQKQLPPTSFFSGLDSLDNSFEDLEARSALEWISKRAITQSTLTAAYRFQHPIPIQFLNEEFYEGKLKTFEACVSREAGNDLSMSSKGLRYHFVKDGVYGRGGNTQNHIEAEALAQKVLEHSRKNAHESLGVVAFSESQKDAIEMAVSKLSALHPELAEFTQKESKDKFFITNLENVQGDERDVVMVSVGYGRDETGRLSMNFGPVNHEGGEHRLNVLFSRARVRLEIFSSLQAQDFTVTPDSPRGVSLLRDFLEYSVQYQNGKETSQGTTQIRKGSELALDIKEALIERGFLVKSEFQGNVSPDLEITRTGSNRVLGILTDASRYQEVAAVRDRDLVFPQILSSRGWELGHISALSWFTNKESEIKRIENIFNNPGSTQTLTDGFVSRRIEREGAAGTLLSAVSLSPYTEAVLSFDSSKNLSTELVRLLKEIIEREGPVHKDVLLERVNKAVGKSSAQLSSAFEESLSALSSQESILHKNKFFSLSRTQIREPRSRRGVAGLASELQYISSEELDLAIKLTVERSLGIKEKQLAEVCLLQVLGLKKMPNDGGQLVMESVARLVERGVIAKDSSQLHIKESR